MKIIWFSFLILICCVIKLNSQNEIRIFGGCNITNTQFHFIDTNTNIDSSTLKSDPSILPIFGVDIQFTLSQKLNLGTGIGLSWMGSRNLYRDIPDEANIDSDLRIGYIRIPVVVSLELTKRLYLVGGYSYNYSFRKNQQFFIIDNNSNPVSVYKKIHHAAVFGIRKDFNNLSLVVNYHKGFSRIYDTKKINADKHSYLTLNGIQVSFGYLLKE